MIVRILTRLVLSVACVLAAASACGATFVVNDTLDAVDSAPGDGNCVVLATGSCTLRAAIMEANALAGDDEIELPIGTYDLTIGGSDEDACATADLDITSNLIITGTDPTRTVVNASLLPTRDRVFHIVLAAAPTSAIREASAAATTRSDKARTERLRAERLSRRGRAAARRRAADGAGR